jgi:hypothetical protein
MAGRFAGQPQVLPAGTIVVDVAANNAGPPWNPDVVIGTKPPTPAMLAIDDDALAKLRAAAAACVPGAPGPQAHHFHLTKVGEVPAGPGAMPAYGVNGGRAPDGMEL